VEVIFPLKDERLRDRVKNEILDAYLADNVKARLLQKDGRYIRAWQAKGKRKAPTGASAFSSQDFLIGIAEGRQQGEGIPEVPSPRRTRKATAGKER
jgi:polyphosphate kinase